MVTIDTAMMIDAFAALFTAMANAITFLLAAAWAGVGGVVDGLLGSTFSGGIWVMLTLLVIVLSAWRIIVRYTDMAGL